MKYEVFKPEKPLVLSLFRIAIGQYGFQFVTTGETDLDYESMEKFFNGLYKNTIEELHNTIIGYDEEEKHFINDVIGVIFYPKFGKHRSKDYHYGANGFRVSAMLICKPLDCWTYGELKEFNLLDAIKKGELK